MTAADVLAAYRDGRRDFWRVDISGADLSNHDLSGASFLGANLHEVNFSGCILTWVQLKGAVVTKANLSNSALNATDLIGANFGGSILRQADLTGAAMGRANLSRADLSQTNLGGTDFADVNLADARLSRAHLFHTVLCDLDVSAFCEESDLDHAGPSFIDSRTVVRSYRHPSLRQFMLDCGVPALFSEYMIDCARAIDNELLAQLMQTTFISYGGPDEGFARRLYDALRARGIVTFFFPQTATVGERVGDEVFRAIHGHDRVLLICSRSALDRPGVIYEIHETLDREARDGGATYLLPITIDDYVFEGWKESDPVLSERVSSRVIGDFRGALHSKRKFESALERVVAALMKKHPGIGSYRA